MQLTRWNKYSSLFQVLIGVLGLISAASAFLLGLLGLAGLFGEIIPPSEGLSALNLAWISALVAILGFISAAFGILGLMNRSLTDQKSILGSLGFNKHSHSLGFRLSWAMLLLWPLFLILGGIASRNPTIAWLLLPPINLLAIGIPVWWAIENARRHLPLGRPQRGWGLFNFTLFLSTPVVMVVELLGFGLVLFFVIVIIAGNPEWVSKMQVLISQLGAVQNNPDNMIVILRPVLSNPLILYLLLAVLSGLAPLVEELLKPLALWALSGRNLSPAGGFAAGALCGGAFALIESLLNLTTPAGDGWTSLVIARAGTAVLHTATSALVGWGLVCAWKNGAYVRLALAYLIAVIFHGLWNGLSVLSLYSSFSNEQIFLMPGWLQVAAPAVPLALIFLVVIHLSLLWGGNRILQKEAERDQSQPAPVDLNPLATSG